MAKKIERRVSVHDADAEWIAVAKETDIFEGNEEPFFWMRATVEVQRRDFGDKEMQNVVRNRVFYVEDGGRPQTRLYLTDLDGEREFITSTRHNLRPEQVLDRACVLSIHELMGI